MKDISPFSYGIDCTKEAVGHFRSLIWNSELYIDLSSSAQTFIDAQLSATARINSQTPMSVLDGRIASVAALCATIDAEYVGLLPSNSDTFFATFAFTKGESELGAPLRNTQTIISRVAAELEKQSLSGLIMPDIDLMYPGDGETPYLAFHLHALVQNKKARIRLKKVAETMIESIGWESSLPRAVDLTGKRPGCIYNNARRMASYQTKFVAAAKRRRFGPKGEYWVLDRSRLNPRLGLYLLHGWSQLSLMRSPVAVGKFGETLHRGWQSNLRSRRNCSASEPYCYSSKEAKSIWSTILQSLG